MANFEKDIVKIVGRWTDINSHVLLGKLRYFDAVASGKLRNNLKVRHFQTAGKVVSEIEMPIYGRFVDAGIYGKVRQKDVPLARRKKKGLGVNAYRKTWYQQTIYPRIGFLRNVAELNLQETILQKIHTILDNGQK